MMDRTFSAAEAAEYAEFKRARRETEAALTKKRMILDASRRETDRHALQAVCSLAVKMGASGVLVSPVNVAPARKMLKRGRVVCLVGGTGESLPAIKKKEAKKAICFGAGEIRLVLCYSALTGGNFSYLKREISKVRRAAKKCALTVSLEDHSLGEEQIALGVRAACEGKADGVCVRGELPLIVRAVQSAAGRVYVDCSGVENTEQLRSALQAGAAHVTTRNAGEICEELADFIRLSAPDLSSLNSSVTGTSFVNSPVTGTSSLNSFPNPYEREISTVVTPPTSPTLETSPIPSSPAPASALDPVKSS